MVKEIKISEREHFRIMCQVFDDVMSNPEYKNNQTKEALIAFSNQAHKKMFSPAKERNGISPKVNRVAMEVLGEK